MKSVAKPTTAEAIFNHMLGRIEQGEWSVGSQIPSERSLMEEYKVSRISVREALSRMRAFGLMRIEHGKKTVVEKMDVRILGKIFPVLLAMEGEQNFLHFLQLRITLETQAAFSAAMNRGPEDVEALQKLLKGMHAVENGMSEEAVEQDYAFHIEIARACKNPLFPMLLEALSGYLAPCQVSAFRWGAEDIAMLQDYHTAIFEAIRDGVPESARRFMENHLRASAGQIISDGVWRRTSTRRKGS